VRVLVDARRIVTDKSCVEKDLLPKPRVELPWAALLLRIFKQDRPYFFFNASSAASNTRYISCSLCSGVSFANS